MPEKINSSAPGHDEVVIRDALIGFTVVDRHNEHVGIVKRVSIERTCLLVESSGSLFRRKHEHAVHHDAIQRIDVERFIIVLAASNDDVADAPEFRDLDARSEAAIEAHYTDRVASSARNL